jgi:hypothetical protein
LFRTRLGTLAGKRANERKREKNEGKPTAVRNGGGRKTEAVKSADIKKDTAF